MLLVFYLILNLIFIQHIVNHYMILIVVFMQIPSYLTYLKVNMNFYELYYKPMRINFKNEKSQLTLDHPLLMHIME
jgi:hypothetical protein